jgi:hypothetical protein
MVLTFFNSQRYPILTESLEWMAVAVTRAAMSSCSLRVEKLG